MLLWRLIFWRLKIKQLENNITITTESLCGPVCFSSMWNVDSVGLKLSSFLREKWEIEALNPDSTSHCMTEPQTFLRVNPQCRPLHLGGSSLIFSTVLGNPLASILGLNLILVSEESQEHEFFYPWARLGLVYMCMYTWKKSISSDDISANSLP